MATKRRSSRNRSHPLDKLLPDDVRARFVEAAESSTLSDAKVAAAVDEEHEISTRFDITRRRLAGYVKRIRERSEKPPTVRTAARTKAFRRRQRSVAAILDSVFGPLAKCEPDLWERRAYLMLVGTMYERLALNEDELSTDELVKLAKVLAENRRVESRLRPEEASNSENGAEREEDLISARVARGIRDVYGVDLVSMQTEEPPKPGDDSSVVQAQSPVRGTFPSGPASMRNTESLGD